NLTDPSGIVAGIDDVGLIGICLLNPVACAAVVVGVIIIGGIIWYGATHDVQAPSLPHIDVEDFVAWCEAYVEELFQKPDTQRKEPHIVPRDDYAGKVIVELGAGDYDNAINMKKSHPLSHVIATNGLRDWEQGKYFYERGLTAEDVPVVGYYEGWLRAKKWSVDVGMLEPYENNGVTDGIGDLVYTILPNPKKAFQFGMDAARIAKLKSGTRVAITEGGGGNAKIFIEGFQRYRRGAEFVPYPGARFGDPGQDWEGGPFKTWIHTVP
ncbi:MAG: hypothetical protein GY797_04320, partial [Deltaproteobacteria bacterium]|nr:hypothetical protein [Deltaproteobacteria bacterium]